MTDVLLATDADWIYDEIEAALASSDLTVRRVRRGQEVSPAIEADEPDLVILDLQIGNMGGLAACSSIRLDESVGPQDERLPILLLLDRDADLFLARRSDADGWLVKPLDAFRLRRAAEALLAGGTWHDAEHMGAAGATDLV